MDNLSNKNGNKTRNKTYSFVKVTKKLSIRATGEFPVTKHLPSLVILYSHQTEVAVLTRLYPKLR